MDRFIEDLTLSNMRINYEKFRELYEPDRADQAMQRVYSTAWEKHRETIWQDYDQIEIHAIRGGQ